MRMSLEQFREYQNKNAQKKHKYFAVSTLVKEVKFPSKAEANLYKILLRMKKIGEITYFIRQIRFDLPGGIYAYIDFMAVKNDGTLWYLDAKGKTMTRTCINKYKQIREIYGVVIDAVYSDRIKQLMNQYLIS